MVFWRGCLSISWFQATTRLITCKLMACLVTLARRHFRVGGPSFRRPTICPILNGQEMDTLALFFCRHQRNRPPLVRRFLSLNTIRLLTYFFTKWFCAEVVMRMSRCGTESTICVWMFLRKRNGGRKFIFKGTFLLILTTWIGPTFYSLLWLRNAIN